MKITTTIERFDKNKFDIGAIYFVEMEIAEMNASFYDRIKYCGLNKKGFSNYENPLFLYFNLI